MIKFRNVMYDKNIIVKGDFKSLISLLPKIQNQFIHLVEIACKYSNLKTSCICIHGSEKLNSDLNLKLNNRANLQSSTLISSKFYGGQDKSSNLQGQDIATPLSIFFYIKAFYKYLKQKNVLRYIVAFVIVVSYLIISNWNLQIATYFSNIVLIFGLLFIGIPHGALDQLISKSKNSSMLIFNLKYLFIIVLYYTFWQFFPLAAFLIFVTYSSFHFGESELIETHTNINSIGDYLKAFMMGLSILLFIICIHLDESISIVSYFITIPKLTSIDIDISFITWILPIISFMYILTQIILSKRWTYLGLLFLLLLGIKVPLMLAFGLYFLFQHSYNAWHNLKLKLNMSSVNLYKKASFYTFGALSIFLLIILFANELNSITNLWSNFFIFIACISFPHFILMHIFYKKQGL